MGGTAPQASLRDHWHRAPVVLPGGLVPLSRWVVGSSPCELLPYLQRCRVLSELFGKLAAEGSSGGSGSGADDACPVRRPEAGPENAMGPAQAADTVRGSLQLRLG